MATKQRVKAMAVILSTFILLIVMSRSVYATLNGPCSVGNKSGVCIKTASCTSAGGTYASGYCLQDPTDVKCCYKDSCASGGTCMWTNQKCSGTFKSGYCPGPANFQCCTTATLSGNDYRKCLEVSATRDGLKKAALWTTVDSKKRIIYSQGTNRWSGIDKYICPTVNLPPYADCSSFVSWLYWSAFGKGPDYLNGENWKGGNTESLYRHGTKVSLAEAQPGDIVLYGVEPYSGENQHSAIYVGQNEVVSFGSTGTPKHKSINNDSRKYQIFTYPKFFTS